MNIDERIADLEASIAELRKLQEIGYTVNDVVEEEYYWSGYHRQVLGKDGNITGIVIDEDVMKKYFEDLAKETK